jgi:hypothetical protein
MVCDQLEGFVFMLTCMNTCVMRTPVFDAVLERYPRGRNALVDAALSVSARGSGASLLGLAAGGRM